MKPIRLQLEYEFPAAPEQVWPILADTELINRSLGLPPTSPQSLRDEPVRRARILTRYLGIPLEWEEDPFEFVENRYYHVRRAVKSGLVRQFDGGVFLEETPTGTRARIESEFLPASQPGVGVVHLILLKTRREWDRIAQHVRAHLQGESEAAFGEGIDVATTDVQEAVRRQLSRIDPELLNEPLWKSLADYLSTAGDLELTRIRPASLARRWQVDRLDVLRLCLRAARYGVLDLSWDLLCPNCRGAPNRWSRLDQVTVSAHCDDCQITFDANFDRAVEVTFRPNAHYRLITEAVFCSAGPRNTPHIVAQKILVPGEITALEVPLVPGRYRVRNLQGDLADWVYVEDQAKHLEFRTNFSAERMSLEPQGEQLQAGSLCWRIENSTATRQQAILERIGSYDECMTAAVVTAYQEFRDLFSSEVLSPNTQLAIRSLPLLFTDLKGSTALYGQLGDAPAYALVRDHFSLLKDVIARHGGGIIKTIGDAVMAAFPTSADALGCAIEIHRSLVTFNQTARQPLCIKIGIHQGPCIAVRSYDDRLDYFGSTVNLAARAHQVSYGDDIIVTEELLQDPGAAELADPLQDEMFETDLRGIGLVRLHRLTLPPPA